MQLYSRWILNTILKLVQLSKFRILHLIISDVAVAAAGSYGHSPSMLEARYSWADGTQGLPLGDATEVVEDEIRRHLEEAMTESPLKDIRKGKGFYCWSF